MKLNEIYTYLKSRQVSVGLDNEQNKILLAANNSTLIEGNASYLVPLVDERTFVRQIKKNIPDCLGRVGIYSQSPQKGPRQIHSDIQEMVRDRRTGETQQIRCAESSYAQETAP